MYDSKKNVFTPKTYHKQTETRNTRILSLVTRQVPRRVLLKERLLSSSEQTLQKQHLTTHYLDVKPALKSEATQNITFSGRQSAFYKKSKPARKSYHLSQRTTTQNCQILKQHWCANAVLFKTSHYRLETYSSPNAAAQDPDEREKLNGTHDHPSRVSNGPRM